MSSNNSLGSICLGLRPFPNLTEKRVFSSTQGFQKQEGCFAVDTSLCYPGGSCLLHSHQSFLLLSDEQSILPCKKEELQCGNGLCLSNWLRCHYKKDCGRDYMSIKLTCSSELPCTFPNCDNVL